MERGLRAPKQTKGCAVASSSRQSYNDSSLIWFGVTNTRLKKALHVWQRVTPGHLNSILESDNNFGPRMFESI